MKIKNALISLYKKDGIEELLEILKKYSVNIYATSSTAKYIKECGYDVHQTEEITGISELLGGRVKTLNTDLFAGILARKDKDDTSKIKVLFDLVVVDLYPFEEYFKNSKNPKEDLDELIEKIDIGGVSLIRAAAKNYKYVGIIVDKNDYKTIAKHIDENDGEIADYTLSLLAQKAFNRVVEYDSTIFKFFSIINENESMLPNNLNLILKKKSDLRYGENPHQKGSLYVVSGSRNSLADLKVIQGKEMSFNNYLDLDAAINITLSFEQPACSIIKHCNPCGVGVGDTISDAFQFAHISDPKSAFGGIIALNRECDEETAEMISPLFMEVIYAPSFSENSLKILSKKKNLRIVEGDVEINKEVELRSLSGCYLAQNKDNIQDNTSFFQVVTEKQPTEKEWAAIYFGWKVVRFVKSNAIVVATPNRTMGICGGQTSRVDAVEIALKKAGGMAAYTGGSALASDGFFPFRDSIDIIAKEGIYAIVQPGGSIKDKEVIEACNEHGISMVFTNVRHFKH
uniref:Bifunctional purine biosynthesis protein PurH n=1 Tax=candidate division WOR-3 bacterium TaxID=2052148 RepID=A0A7C3J6P8_UNCW3